ncbi:hypothetical protein DFH07DRAFT_784216 [Mycena maculata]|uniref:Uncharacterized protein n=1 Tax=Mycena maculata TaxID=230809 RepID=A0AAD7HHS7_9AGAR|nr:hypothetical protein DFH07DRAFT_784216 [Mycena maculata]
MRPLPSWRSYVAADVGRRGAGGVGAPSPVATAGVLGATDTGTVAGAVLLAALLVASVLVVFLAASARPESVTGVGAAVAAGAGCRGYGRSCGGRGRHYGWYCAGASGVPGGFSASGIGYGHRSRRCSERGRGRSG